MWSGLGLLLGAAIGIVLWRATDTVALFPVFVGVGLVFGLLIARFQESDRERD